MATVTPSMKHNVAIITVIVTGLILLMGTIPVISIGFSYNILGLGFTLGQALGILNLIVAWFLYKKELR